MKIVAVVMFLLILLTPACTPAERQQFVNWLQAEAVAVGPCLLDCGLQAAVDSGIQAIRVRKVDGSAVLADSLSCITKCVTSTDLAVVTRALKGSGFGAGPVSYEVTLEPYQHP